MGSNGKNLIDRNESEHAGVALDFGHNMTTSLLGIGEVSLRRAAILDAEIRNLSWRMLGWLVAVCQERMVA